MTDFPASDIDEFPIGDASRARLLAHVERSLQRARQRYPALPSPRVWYDLRGRSAGQAHYGRGGLRFNMTLYGEQPETFLTEVVPHEMAHWVVHHVYPGRVRPHGAQWQQVMIEIFDRPPSVTHRFDTSRASPAPYAYLCGCRRHYFTLRRHNNERRGSRYRCRYCGETLRLETQADQVVGDHGEKRMVEQ
ncbi:SprT-like domain-containing protein [Kushneria konosiri]|uniref:Metallopeptidase n=1 Tax=Kushneria konosiri TaxID=698828 RepID=A0A2Z2H7W3_9GAMM|nr:SprT-like domain-containing protein [Kushneria konosiri]ARS53424.1 metallopeptidase [Kushneria konosiri]